MKTFDRDRKTRDVIDCQPVQPRSGKGMIVSSVLTTLRGAITDSGVSLAGLAMSSSTVVAMVSVSARSARRRAPVDRRGAGLSLLIEPGHLGQVGVCRAHQRGVE